MVEEKGGSVLSPCTDQCELTREGYCRGCFRTMEEIANWSEMTEEERKRIMADLPKRKMRILHENKKRSR